MEGDIFFDFFSDTQKDNPLQLALAKDKVVQVVNSSTFIT
jgi:hypothetical protein